MGQVNNLEVLEHGRDDRDEILVVNEDVFSHAKQTELKTGKETMYLRRKKIKDRNAYQRGGCAHSRKHSSALNPKLD